MGLAIKYAVPRTQGNVQTELEWCNNQGWRHIVDWRWFHNDSSFPDSTVQFHFEDDRHAHWFLLTWGGEVIGQI